MNLLLYAGAAIIILGMLGGIGYKVRKSGYDACKVEWAEAAEEQRKREQELSTLAAKALADERAKRKVVIQTRTQYVEKIVDRPVYSNVCVDADGLRCIAAAINGQDDAGCKLGGTLPATKPAN